MIRHVSASFPIGSNGNLAGRLSGKGEHFEFTITFPHWLQNSSFYGFYWQLYLAQLLWAIMLQGG